MVKRCTWWWKPRLASGPRDVARARRRADILARKGVRTLGVVGGEQIDPDAAGLAISTGVEVVTDGRRPEAS